MRRRLAREAIAANVGFDQLDRPPHNHLMDGPDLVFDRALIGHRRRRASRNTVPIADFLLLAAAKELVERLATVKRKFAIAADIGSPLPHVVQHLCANGQVKRVVRIDRDPVERDRSNPIVIGDEEYLPFRAGSLDLATSILALQFVNDLPGALVQIRRALKPDGLFLGALLGGDTLTELRQSFATAEAELTGGASPRVAPFAGLRAVGALLQRAGFELPVVDQDRITVRYDTMFDVLRDLRAMGATNALVERSRRPLRRSVLMRAAAVYAEQSADPDGRIRATFDLIWLSGWSPHESQQKPLQPGSAKVRLADVLGTTERSAGDKTGR